MRPMLACPAPLILAVSCRGVVPFVARRIFVVLFVVCNLIVCSKALLEALAALSTSVARKVRGALVPEMKWPSVILSITVKHLGDEVCSALRLRDFH